MDLTVAGLIAIASSTILGYTTKVWQYGSWNTRVSLDAMQNIINNNKGMHLKFTEDKVDPLNPTRDSGVLINRHWYCSYSSAGMDTKNAGMNFFGMGGESGGDLTYTISTSRIHRKKLLKIIDSAVNSKSKDRANKIYLVSTNSIYFVGDISEQYVDIPDVIMERLNGGRTTRLNIFLHGEPGTGKTTMARAIAQKLEMPIYIVALNAWWDITDLIRGLQRIPDDSVILFDDLDIMLEQLLRAEVDKTNSSMPLRFSTASIMAFLDGIFMKNKRWIVIMCTNDGPKVKRLLRLRPGRVHIDYECTEKYVNDYVEAAQEAKVIVDKYREEAEKAKAEAKVTEGIPPTAGDKPRAG